MKRFLLNGLLAATILGSGLAATLAPRDAAAAKFVSFVGCVVERKAEAVLMTMGDGINFEVDLRKVKNNPFALNPGECVLVEGWDGAPKREFSQAAYAIEAQQILAPEDEVGTEQHKDSDPDEN